MFVDPRRLPLWSLGVWSLDVLTCRVQCAPCNIWQLRQSLNAGKDANPQDDFIANLEPADSFTWIRISVAKDGTFTVTNTRNGFSKRYGK